MSEDYRTMWKSLNLDLESHDMLLNVLGAAYQEIFLSQKNRPEGMKYFDFVMSEVHGLRIKELLNEKAAGHKIIGSYCLFVPEEIIKASGSTHVGLCTGADFATDKVEQFLPRSTCSLIKSALGFKLGRVCPYVEASDMVVGENTCDGKKKAYEIFGKIIPNFYVMDLPQMKTESGKALMKAEYLRFKNELEKFTGVVINATNLKQGIRIVNEKRRAIHRLSKLRSADPAPISGLDSLLINQVSFYDDPARFTGAVNAICNELEQRVQKREGVFLPGTPRILVSGCPMAVPNWKVASIIENSGAVIVGEESCVGERGMRNLTDESGKTVEELLEAIVERYFKIDCAVFTPNPDRFNHTIEMIHAYYADGLIHYALNFCQPYIIESIGIEKALEEKKIPAIRIETDYSMEDVGQLKTRIEAFIERIR